MCVCLCLCVLWCWLVARAHRYWGSAYSSITVLCFVAYASVNVFVIILRCRCLAVLQRAHSDALREQLSAAYAFSHNQPAVGQQQPGSASMRQPLRQSSRAFVAQLSGTAQAEGGDEEQGLVPSRLGWSKHEHAREADFARLQAIAFKQGAACQRPVVLLQLVGTVLWGTSVWAYIHKATLSASQTMSWLTMFLLVASFVAGIVMTLGLVAYPAMECNRWSHRTVMLIACSPSVGVLAYAYPDWMRNHLREMQQLQAEPESHRGTAGGSLDEREQLLAAAEGRAMGAGAPSLAPNTGSVLPTVRSGATLGTVGGLGAGMSMNFAFGGSGGGGMGAAGDMMVASLVRRRLVQFYLHAPCLFRLYGIPPSVHYLLVFLLGLMLPLLLSAIGLKGK